MINFQVTATVRSLLTAVCSFFLLAFSASIHAALPPLEGLAADSEVTLFNIHGSNTIGAALAPALATKYLKEKGATSIETVSAGVENEYWIQGKIATTNTLVRIGVAAHGSGTGFRSLASGEADIAAASRPVKEKEATKLAGLADMTSGKAEHILAIDGLAVIVHPDNPIRDLSVTEIAEIFSGGYSDWSEVGGKAGAIKIYARDEKSGTWDSFKRMVLGKEYTLASGADRYESNDDLSDKVSKDPNGIGFVGLASVGDSVAIAVSDGTAKSLVPNKLTVGTEDYALSRRLYLYTDDEISNPYAKEFITYVQGQAGQDVVSDTGFISQNVYAVTPEFTAETPDDYRTLTEQSERLTVNFRFREGSAKLDNRAQKDIERLVEYFNKTGSREVLLIGFGDQKKSEKRSRLLSKLRAMAVRRELVRNGIYPKAVGYGQSLPVASNERSEGRMKNRRVEVWVRKAS